jgi:hypothetical protein
MPSANNGWAWTNGKFFKQVCERAKIHSKRVEHGVPFVRDRWLQQESTPSRGEAESPRAELPHASFSQLLPPAMLCVARTDPPDGTPG